MKIKLRRVNDAVHFQASNATGNVIDLDGSESIGGENLGARPMEVMLMSLAGCSGIDILSILNKQRQNVTDFAVDVDGERRDEVPKVFTKIDVTVHAEGDINPEKLKKAVELSSTKYCSVVAMLEKTAEINFHIVLNHEILK